MAAPKELFLRNKELVKEALAILKSDAFAQILVFAKAEFASRNPTNEQMTGGNVFESTLINLVEGVEPPQEFPTPGLQHNLEVKRNELVNENLTKK